MAATLDHELRTFRRVLPDLLADPAKAGRFVLIHGDQVADVYPTFEAALDAGYDRFELAPFLVKRVAAHEEPVYFSRNISPCP
jgi:hypothetical protein